MTLRDAGPEEYTQMAREIRLYAFDMNCVGHQASGLWRHPRDRSATYNTLGYWTHLAQVLERGLFDDDLIRAHRERALSPDHPALRGSGSGGPLVQLSVFGS